MRRMILIRACVQLLFALILAALGASLLCAQNVPPPPKPAPDGPSLAQTLDSLKQTLRSSGRLDYTEDGSDRSFSITDVTVNPAECTMRVNYIQTVGGQPPREFPDSTSYFFEAIDTAEVMTLQESANRASGYSDSSKLSDGYAAVINGNGGIFLAFADRETATRVAGLLRRASEVCRALPLQLNSAAGDPNLSDTLRFIEQKLNKETSVAYESRTGDISHRVSFQVEYAHGDSATCQVRYRVLMTSDGKPFLDRETVLSFRRVQKLEVLTEQDFSNHLMEQDGFDTRFVVTPAVYRLIVTDSGGQAMAWVESADEAMADRVAKAMNHAAELCGSNKTKEPF
jgi:hypothetical protein